MRGGLRLGRTAISLLGAAAGLCAVSNGSAAQAQGLQLGGSVRAQADDRGASAGGRAGLDAASQGAAEPQAGAAPASPTPDTPRGAVHVVQEGDTLWGISEKYFHDPYQWPRLWSYNPEITNPHFIYPGQVLRLEPAAGSQGWASSEEAEVPARRDISTRPVPEILLREQAYLDQDALKQAGVIVGSPESHMLLTAGDLLYVRFDEPPPAPVGKEMAIYRHVTKAENASRASNYPRYDPDKDPGEIVRILGSVKVLSYDSETHLARGEIVEALDVIERGFRVADAPRRFVRVPPRTNERSVESTVVAAMRPVELIGQNQVVFLGAGDKQGVKPGNRFFVVRHHDGWRRTLPKPSESAMGASRPVSPMPDESPFPEDILAEIVVLHTRPESATGMVTHAIRDIAPGDRVRMPDGY